MDFSHRADISGEDSWATLLHTCHTASMFPSKKTLSFQAFEQSVTRMKKMRPMVSLGEIFQNFARV